MRKTKETATRKGYFVQISIQALSIQTSFPPKSGSSPTLLASGHKME